MRHLIALLGLTLLTLPAGAQSEFVRDAGAYVVLNALDPIRLGSGHLEVEAGTGWRFGNGLDVGVRGGAAHTSFDATSRTLSESSRLAVGLEVGYAARLGQRSGLRFQFQGALEQTVEVAAPNAPPRWGGGRTLVDWRETDQNAGGVRASAAFFRRVAVGSVTVQPAVGAFWSGAVLTSAPSDRPFTLRADTRTSRSVTKTGVTLGLPVVFQAGDVDLAIGPHVEVDLNRDRIDGGLRLRSNF